MTTTQGTRTPLISYGNELVAAGFEVWLTKTTWGGYLQYRDPATGNAGTFQSAEWGGYRHLMPLVPSRRYGSSMHLDTDTDPWTVEAARECAADANYNSAVRARLANARDRTWRSPSAIALHGE